MLPCLQTDGRGEGQQGHSCFFNCPVKEFGHDCPLGQSFPAIASTNNQPAANPTGPVRISTFKYVPVRTILLILVLPCTSMCLHVLLLVPSCTTLQHLVPPCTMIEVSRTAMSPDRYVLAHTGTYRLVPPYTRCRGFKFQMSR